MRMPSGLRDDWRRLDEVLDGFVTLHHDVGFMWLPSAVIDYKLTGSEEARIRGLKAASHLAGRFNLAGQFIRAWTDEVNPAPEGGPSSTVMMNIPLLFWASRESKDPRFYHIAKAHADTVLRCFIRPDNTSAHIVSFDPYTGERLRIWAAREDGRFCLVQRPGLDDLWDGACIPGRLGRRSI